jgi:hypothetical protein
MADALLGAVNLNYTDIRRTQGAATNPITNYAETEDITAIKTALNTFDAFTYTAENMATMTLNDLIFAWRACRGQQASITDYYPAQTARVA